MARKYTPDDTLVMEPLKHKATLKEELTAIPAELPKVQEPEMVLASKPKYMGYVLASVDSDMPYQVTAGQVSITDYAKACSVCGGKDPIFFVEGPKTGLAFWRCCTKIDSGYVVDRSTGAVLVLGKGAKGCPSCGKKAAPVVHNGHEYHKCCYTLKTVTDENGYYVSDENGNLISKITPKSDYIKLLPTGKLCLHDTAPGTFYEDGAKSCPSCSSMTHAKVVALASFKTHSYKHYWNCCYKVCENNTHIILKSPPAEKVIPSHVGLVNWFQEDVHDHECPNSDAHVGTGTVAPVEGSRLYVWNCCYQACTKCFVPHAFLKEDSCPGCGACPNTCKCLFCAEDKVKAESLCKHCSKCKEHCECKICGECGIAYPEDKFCKDCGSCKQTYGHCSCTDCKICKKHVVKSAKDYDWCPACNNCSEHCGHENPNLPKVRGEVETVGWHRRGQHVTLKRHDVNYDLFQSIAPHSKMAKFYLLSFMEIPHDVPCTNRELLSAYGVVVEEIKQKKQKLVDLLDPIFQLYVDIAVGGELRHHPALQHQGLNRDRSVAWKEWLSIREQIGPEALLDGVEVFRDMGRGYGGRKWAAAAKLLYQRVTNEIPDWLFVDRVFTMQHNAGSLLNKVSWAATDADSRTRFHWEYIKLIGDAHSAKQPDLELLLANSDDETETTFYDWLRFKNRLLMEARQPLLVVPSWRLKVSGSGSGAFYRDRHGHNFLLKNYLSWSRIIKNGGKFTNPEGLCSDSYCCPLCSSESSKLKFDEYDYYWGCCFGMTEKGDIVKLPPRPKGIGRCPACKGKIKFFQTFDWGSQEWYWRCCFKVQDNQIVPKNVAVEKALAKASESKINCSGCGKFSSKGYVHSKCGAATNHGCCKCSIEGDHHLPHAIVSSEKYCPRCGENKKYVNFKLDDCTVYDENGHEHMVWACCYAVVDGKKIILRKDLPKSGKSTYKGNEPWFYGGLSKQKYCPNCKMSIHEINTKRHQYGIKPWEATMMPVGTGYNKFNVHAYACCFSVFAGQVVWDATGEAVLLDEFEYCSDYDSVLYGAQKAKTPIGQFVSNPEEEEEPEYYDEDEYEDEEPDYDEDEYEDEEPDTKVVHHANTSFMPWVMTTTTNTVTFTNQ